MTDSRYLDEIAKVEARRVQALEDQDPEIYACLCDGLGISLDSIEDKILYSLGAERINDYVNSIETNDSLKKIGSSIPEIKLRKRASFGLEGKPRKKRKRKNQDKYDALAKVADEEGVNVRNALADTNIKIKHLKEIMGYSRLRVGKGPEGFVSIDGAKPERIGRVYQDIYNMAEE